MPVIRIDDQVWQRLEEMTATRPFSLTPNKILREVLGMENESKPRSKDQRHRRRIARLLSRTPASSFEFPILKALLVGSGGKATVNVVLKRVELEMKNILKEEDRKTLGDAGEIRWHNSAKMARRELVKRGYLNKDSEHGFWQITDAGREYVDGNLPF